MSPRALRFSPAGRSGRVRRGECVHGASRGAGAAVAVRPCRGGGAGGGAPTRIRPDRTGRVVPREHLGDRRVRCRWRRRRRSSPRRGRAGGRRGRRRAVPGRGWSGRSHRAEAVLHLAQRAVPARESTPAPAPIRPRCWGHGRAIRGRQARRCLLGGANRCRRSVPESRRGVGDEPGTPRAGGRLRQRAPSLIARKRCALARPRSVPGDSSPHRLSFSWS